MRFLAQLSLGLGLSGLALAAAPAVLGQEASRVVYYQQPQAVVQGPSHKHKSLFAARHCVECQRAAVLKRDGVDVPPPPAMVAGTVVGQPIHVQGDPSNCAACQAGTVVTGPVTVVETYPPGHAVVGGPVMVANGAPGYAVVGGGYAPAMVAADPSPVGVSQAAQGRWSPPRVAQGGARPGAGPYDPSVMPSSMIPAQTALSNPPAGRPHVIRHLLGISAIGRHRREAREERTRESHASISYSPPNEPITELPASVVYGKKH